MIKDLQRFQMPEMKNLRDKGAKELLKNIAAEIQTDLNDQELELFEIYLRELNEWNRKINITSIKNTEDIIIKHFIDSLYVLKYVTLSGKIADIGSGGGFPGIPLKIKKPALDMVLIESSRKKANFLQHAIRSLHLKGIVVYNGRAEEFAGKGYFDFAISRALADLTSLCILALPLLKMGGHIVSMKGKEAEKEIKEKQLQDNGAKLIRMSSFTLPRDKGRRNIILIQKCFT